MSQVYTLENDFVKVQVSSYGAEMVSLVDKTRNRELMWSGDPAYWGRVSPVLFPLVGNYRNKEITYDGHVYQSGQHGFARDMEFVLVSKMDDELWFTLQDNEESLKHYPFHFSLLIGYRISGRNVRVMWNVMNRDRRMIYFSIGGHPAFVSPVDGAALEFDVHGTITANVLDENGLVSNETKDFELDDSRLALTHEMFDGDALIFEKQIQQVTLLDEEGADVLTMSFDAPLLGVWTPAKRDAPFICIEPWYGRTDRADFEGDLTNREWGNSLKPHDVFSAHYELEIA